MVVVHAVVLDIVSKLSMYRDIVSSKRSHHSIYSGTGTVYEMSNIRHMY